MDAKNFIAEDVRPEQGAKLTVVGMFPDDTIHMHGPLPGQAPPPNAVPAIPKLCIVCAIKSLEPGGYNFFGSLKMPSGKHMIEKMQLGSVVLNRKSSHTAVLQIAPFVAEELGDYTFELTAGDETVSYVFTVSDAATEDAVRLPL